MFNKFRFEVLIQSKSEVDQQINLGPFHLHGRAGMLNFLLFSILEIAKNCQINVFYPSRLAAIGTQRGDAGVSADWPGKRIQLHTVFF